MNSFDDRRKGFEAEYQRQQDMAFRVTARRNKLLGLWAAKRLGLAPGDAAEAYAGTVVAADFEAPGDDDVVKKVRNDLAASGIDITEAEVRAELSRAAVEAREQLARK
jgi:hypothetical protein